MKRVIILCEGVTEREFCKNILASYFAADDIHIQAPLIKKSMGGIVNWVVLKKEIETHLKDRTSIVTMLIDYYGISKKHGFPGWEEGERILDKNNRMNSLEEAMRRDISPAVRHRFIPYLQLHEFESLLFTDIQIFYDQVPKEALTGIEELKETFAKYDNPEMINDKKETSPGHRLQRIIKGYDKPLYGHYFAEAIGIDKMAAKCPRFKGWLQKMKSI